MARKTSYNRVIFSAGEIGAYSVCPEAWRLRTLERVRVDRTKAMQQGQELHEEWVAKFEETVTLTRTVRYVVLLVLAALCGTCVVSLL